MNNEMMQVVALLETSISSAVILLWMGQKLFGAQGPFAIRILLLLALVNLLFWPLGMGMELPLSAYVRGVTGDLSIVTMLLLWASILPNAKRVPLPFMVALILLAIPFYPMALGLGMIDPYAWGIWLHSSGWSSDCSSIYLRFGQLDKGRLDTVICTGCLVYALA
jgi:hypothetical protein